MDYGFAVGTREWLACGQKWPRVSVGQSRREDALALLKLPSGDGYPLSNRARRVRFYALLSYHGLIHSRHTKCTVLSSTNGFVDRSDGERAAPKDSFVYPTQEFLRSFEKSSTGSLCQ